MTNPSDMTYAELADALDEHSSIEETGGCADLQFTANAPLMREAASRLRAMEWQPIETAPDSDDKQLYVFVIGGRYNKATRVPADGSYWRELAAQGLKSVPEYWVSDFPSPAPKGE